MVTVMRRALIKHAIGMITIAPQLMKAVAMAAYRIGLMTRNAMSCSRTREATKARAARRREAKSMLLTSSSQVERAAAARVGAPLTAGRPPSAFLTGLSRGLEPRIADSAGHACCCGCCFLADHTPPSALQVEAATRLSGLLLWLPDISIRLPTR